MEIGLLKMLKTVMMGIISMVMAVINNARFSLLLTDAMYLERVHTVNKLLFVEMATHYLKPDFLIRQFQL